MSLLRKGTGIGDKNSQFGTCWITKEGENKKIKKEQFEDYLNDGWIKGRNTKKDLVDQKSLHIFVKQIRIKVHRNFEKIKSSITTKGLLK